LGAKFKSTIVDGATFCELFFYTDQNCSSMIFEGNANARISLDTGGPDWTPISIAFNTPTTAHSTFVECFLLQANMDQIYLNPNANTF
jgi:hypothetical protein